MTKQQIQKWFSTLEPVRFYYAGKWYAFFRASNDSFLYIFEVEDENYKFITEIPKIAIVKADKNKINQVLYNLINNAINYTGDDLTVKIFVKEYKKNYLVEVIDSGKGINNQDLQNIWDKYYKKERNHKRNVVGTGLGLFIVKGILESHNFKFGVKSKLNKGTDFYFYINKP